MANGEEGREGKRRVAGTLTLITVNGTMSLGLMMICYCNCLISSLRPPNLASLLAVSVAKNEIISFPQKMKKLFFPNKKKRKTWFS